jgi:hypothetical protein
MHTPSEVSALGSKTGDKILKHRMKAVHKTKTKEEKKLDPSLVVIIKSCNLVN